jgi:hypothetical protein
MKTPPQFLPLLKQMLGFNRFGPWPLLAYLVVCTTVLFVSLPLFPAGWMEAHARREFASGEDVVGYGALFGLVALISTPLGFQLLGGTMSLEFLFTRAIDRAVWLRTERIAVIIIALGPLILNLLLSPLAPELAYENSSAGFPAKTVLQRYQQIFPGSDLLPADAKNGPRMLINHGNVMFAAWAVWLGLVGVFLAAGYFAVVFGAWQRAGWHHSKSRFRPWLGFIMVNAPAYAIVPLFIICSALHVSLFEESFLLFAAHPFLMIAALIALIVIVQPMTERGIEKLEFEFF